MKSPFPGMDPYLMTKWTDVHSTLITFIKLALQKVLPDDLTATAEEQVLLETNEDQRSQWYKADVAVVVEGGLATGTGASHDLGESPGAVMIELQAPPEIDRWIEIVDAVQGNKLVTAVEVLSPWNKFAGRLNRKYRRKLRDYMRAGVNIVEIDLLKTSRRRLVIPLELLPPQNRKDFFVGVWEARHPSRWRVYPASVRESLPRVLVPLREGDKPVILPMQDLMVQVYEAGRYRTLYAEPPRGSWSEGDRAWMAGVVKSGLAGKEGG